ncbi:MAG: type II and III secretion system protein family protein [Acidobacteria bacterium]|nr:type II and III secretion system protein family protein [Acidobacteriota bacterium]
MKTIAIPLLILAVLGNGRALAQDAGQVLASPAAAVRSSAGEAGAGIIPVTLLVGRSTLIDVGQPITRVSLTNADIADALVTSSQQLLLHGKAPGTISMFVWERSGGLYRYEVAVRRDLARLEEQFKTLFPGEAIDVLGNGSRIVLAGRASSKDVVERAVDVAAGFAERREDVVSLLQVPPAPRSNQVLLRVRFAEVSRSAMTELGLSLFTSPLGVENTLGRITTGQFAAPGFTDLKWAKHSLEFGAPVTSAEGQFTFSDFLNLFVLSQRYDLGLMIRALQNRGLFESLAEPNLVAESGKEASFLAGGEFPIPVAQGSGANLAISVQFKEFGIRLSFTPTVSGDRVHLKVRPEVSMLDFNNAVVLQGFRIPALTTRRTETELELRDGQTFAIAGLMNNSMNSALQKIPGIGDIPILGYLFRSKAARKDQTELVVIITPEILPTDSAGVTSELPRLNEPFLPREPENRTIEPPPPAFTPPSAPPAGAFDAAPAQPEPAVPAPRAGAPSVALSPAERKAIEQARRAELAAREKAAKEERAAAKALAKAAEEQRRVEEAERKRQERLAREQATRDQQAVKKAAEEAQKAAEQARREAEAEQKRLAAIEEARARLRALEEQ